MSRSRWPVSEVAVPSLTCRGRTPDADLIYRHLVRSGPRPVCEIVTELGMPRRRVADALDELAVVRAVVRYPARGAADPQWVARPPAEVLESLRRRPPGPAPVARGRARQLIAAGAAATGPGATSRLLGDGVRHLPSREATRARLAELVTVARHEHLAMHPEQVFDAESLRSAAPMDRTLLRRGVRMRVLGVQPADTDPPVGHRATATQTLPEYRMSATLPVKLLVIDRKFAFFPVTPDNVERGYLEVAQPPIVSALVAMFEQHWESADAPQECTLSQIDLTPRERALVALLAQGHTDATAALELRISPRSVTNILRSLMDRLGVTNRFQLGLALGAAHTAAPPSAPPAERNNC
ncbi:helix-turn-helix transcriptional regulator [Micromonospora sp. NBC_01813]|uniref:helix-turn-helix transcriptional regulator n=1 Tax=Micromonospora sp. NBC_01813 TaxID=2975988 RepID=UPI002DD9B979|nr:helix-turn-helix transcriptional regulator [Micromonospora sp. NBC_01813]WSA09783.1 helix-turn-helix transcriptional regulator [Micromonospora sp. NBC_01813]